MPHILAFSGSARKGSFNQQLAQVAARGAESAGAAVKVVNLGDYGLPLYDQDLEAAEGLPAGAKQFKADLAEAQGLLIASPEYNSSVTPLLKNAIDWASRPASEDEGPLASFRGKTALLLAASPGGLGGLRGLVALRMLLGNIGIMVLPDQRAVSQAHKAFDEAGNLLDAELKASIESLAKTLVQSLK
jgi:NAD(P)H-dependent FMN reductase